MLESIIDTLAYGSILFTAVAAYLQLNKLWSRKHIASVAESVSIAGILVESIPLFFFGVYYLRKGEIIGIADSAIWLISAVLFALIGSGYWVRGRRSVSLWKLALNSIRKEGKELSVLAKEIIHPSSANEMLDVLIHIAAVDGEVAEREKQIIEEFAGHADLDVDWTRVDETLSASGRIIEARRVLDRYLDHTPPETQVSYLMDFIQILIDSDDHAAPEEVLAFDEIKGQIKQYLSQEGAEPHYEVLLSPDGDEQDKAISLMLKNVDRHSSAGGRGYTVGQYFTRSYADVVCAEYRVLGFFSVVVEVLTNQSEATTA
ncbi:MAG: hypothetical protein V7746_02610 [Halioglobus sp.]